MSNSEKHKMTLDVDAWLDNPKRAIETMTTHSESGLSIDVSEAKPIPAQVAQLLVSAKKTIEASGATFELASPNEKVIRSLSVLGLFEYFLEPSS